MDFYVKHLYSAFAKTWLCIISHWILWTKKIPTSMHISQRINYVSLIIRHNWISTPFFKLSRCREVLLLNQDLIQWWFIFNSYCCSQHLWGDKQRFTIVVWSIVFLLFILMSILMTVWFAYICKLCRHPHKATKVCSWMVVLRYTVTLVLYTEFNSMNLMACPLVLGIRQSCCNAA